MLMSKAEYAKHKGVSRQTVYDWIEKGEVVMSGKKSMWKRQSSGTAHQHREKTQFLKCGQRERWK
ncbi:Uncharacterised protein [Escherichia coli]|nr:Uncharacterised protein [Escherichia coli]